VLWNGSAFTNKITERERERERQTDRQAGRQIQTETERDAVWLQTLFQVAELETARLLVGLYATEVCDCTGGGVSSLDREMLKHR